MQRSLWMGAVLAVALGAIACGNDVEDPGTATTTGSGAGGATAIGDLPCDVQEMLADRCQQCHAAVPQFGAPMPLVTRSDLLAPSLDGTATVAEAAVARMTADSRMPPPPNEPATADEIATLQGWIDAGAPIRGNGDTCDGTGTGGGGSGPGCSPDVTLTAAAPFEMPSTSADEQVCFGIDLPGGDVKRQITAIAPRIDNSKIIHHILLLRAPEAVSPEPTSCGFTNVDWQLLYAWGPGTPAHVLPDEAGFPLEAGEDAHFVLQVHYNNLQGLEGEMDQSGVELCTTDQLRPNDAGIMAFGSIGFNGIPPMSTTRLDCATEVPSQIAGFLPLTIFQSWPHMHVLGSAFSSSVVSGNETQTLAEVDDYDFEYQLAYDNDVTVNAGDTIHTSCTWNNSTTSEVGFGEDTLDEMCFNFVSYYPRVEADFWNWLAPAALGDCVMSTP